MKRPFRLGTTSFIYTDHVLPNVQRLADRVDDVQILFFDIARQADLPGPADLRRLAALKETHGLTYTLHTPLDVALGSANEDIRQASVTKVVEACAIATPLAPERVVVHIEKETDNEVAWRERVRRSVASLLEEAERRGLNLTGRTLCVENLDYDLALIDPVIREFDLGVTADVGHLLRDGWDLMPMLEQYLPRIRVIHWHGVNGDGRDHRSLAHYPRELGRELLAYLFAANYDGVVTLEVFSQRDLAESERVLADWLGEDMLVSPKATIEEEA